MAATLLGMTVASDSMTRRVVVAPPELRLSAAWELMSSEGFRHLPVVSGGRLVGILSDRDILLQASCEDGAVRIDPEQKVGVVATPWPYTCSPHADVRALVRVMVDRKIDAVPVLGEDGRLEGLVTSTDLLLLLLRGDEAKIPLPFVFELENCAAIAA